MFCGEFSRLACEPWGRERGSGIRHTLPPLDVPSREWVESGESGRRRESNGCFAGGLGLLVQWRRRGGGGETGAEGGETSILSSSAHLWGWGDKLLVNGGIGIGMDGLVESGRE